MVVGLFLAQSAKEAKAGQRALEALRDDVDASDLLSGEAIDEMRAAQRHFDRAEARSGAVVVAPVRVLPFVGRQVRSLHALSEAAEELVDASADAVDEVSAAFDTERFSGADRVESVRSVASAVADASDRVASISLGPSEALVGPLADARERFAEELAELDTVLARSRTMSAGLTAFLEGPRRYLVLAANNAEMQAGWGMPLSAGVLTVDEGELSLDGMRSIDEVGVSPGAVPLTGDLADNWSGLSPNEEWRNLALTPRFDQAAPLAAEMWRAATGEGVDGVLALDPFALQALLAATGPVDVDGQAIGVDEVVAFALHDQYLTQQADSDTTARRERLSEVAVAAVGAFTDGEPDLPILAERMGDAARGRHVLAWSSIPDDAAVWEAARVDGTLGPDSLMLGLINRAGNKVDWFVDVHAGLELAAIDAGGTEATVTARIVNGIPAGEPPYITGPLPTLDTAAGEHLGFFTLYVPGDATDIAMEGSVVPMEIGRSGPTTMVRGVVRVPAGSEHVVTVRFRLPDDRSTIRIEPTGRARLATWYVEGQEFTDDQAHTVSVTDLR